jgi:hypothetical protein
MSKDAWSTSNLLLEHNDVKANTLIITKSNEVYMKVDAEPVIRQELSDYFTFSVPNAKFTPAYRNRMWDGKIKLFNAMTKELYLGLLPYVEHFANERDYEIELAENVEVQNSFSLKENSSIVSIQSLRQEIIRLIVSLISFVIIVVYLYHLRLLVSHLLSGFLFNTINQKL